MNNKYFLMRLMTIIAVITTILLPTDIMAAPQKDAEVVFLPLGINASEGALQLTDKADELLAEAASAHKMSFIQRHAIANLTKESSWPPPLSAVKPYLPKNYTGSVAMGSLSRFGTQISFDLTVYDLRDPAAPGTFFEKISSEEDIAGAFEKVIKKIKTFGKRQQLISEIRVTGNSRIDTGAIRRKISSLPGNNFNATALTNDLKTVFAMGYFDDISVSSEETPNGHVVTFDIEEKPVIGSIKISGNDELDEATIQDVIKIRASSIISDKEVKESIANIKNLYSEEGYFDCKISVEHKESDRKGRVDLTFVIKEGNKIYIKEINLTGNHSFSDRKIKKSITTSEKGWFSFLTDSGLMHREKLKHDASKITAFYHNNGFVEARVGEPEIVLKDDWLYVYFNIDEGERYKCGAIQLSGDLIVGREILIDLIKVNQEEFFNRMVLRQDVLRLTDYYAEKGYAFSEVSPRSSKNPDEKTVDLNFQIDQGPLVTINRINIKGNTRTRDKVIRREIMLEEGGLFNAVKLKQSNQRLSRTDFFEDVNISPVPGIDDTQMDLDVEVKEKPTGKFSVGAGYSTVDKATFMGEISENNLFGRGQRLSAQANLSSNATKFNLDFTEPHIFDTKVLFGFSAYNWEREYDEYTKDSTGGSLRFGYPLFEKWKSNVGYYYDDTTLTDVDLINASREILNSMDYHVTSSLKLSLSRDTRNRMYGASKGSRNLLTVEYAGGPLGGDNSFTKVEASTGWYLPMSRNTTLHPKLSTGYVAANSEGHLPVYEKFYLGGLSSIRSFEYGEISPVDPVTGDRIGGDKMWYANLEYIFPLAKSQGLMGVAFYDIGNVYDIDEGWQMRDFKHSAGVGFRWMSPIGPLRLEWAQNLDPEGDEDEKNWEFSIGGAF